MKKLSSFSVLFIFCLFFFSCSQNKQKLLIGTWQYTNADVSILGNSITEDQKQQIAGQKQQINQAISSIQITLNTDGTYRRSSPSLGDNRGRWSLSSDRSKLIMQDDIDGSPQAIWEIENLTDKNLKISNTSQNIKNEFSLKKI